MMINGEPKLSCHAFLRNYDGVIRVEPLANFPIERDLITVADDFIDKLKRVKPYLIPRGTNRSRRASTSKLRRS
jgi:fumarate reductase iron-sulfur subunit